MITAGLVTSFKQEILLGIHDLDTDVIKIALYDSSVVLGPDTTVYTTVGEVTSAGYTAGGEVLLSPQVGGANGTGYADFADPIWYATTFSVRAALIYNYTKSNKAIGVLNFGLDQVTLNQDFQIQFPSFTPRYSLIRIV